MTPIICRCGHTLTSHAHNDTSNRSCRACVHCGRNHAAHRPHYTCPFQLCSCRDWQRVGK